MPPAPVRFTVVPEAICGVAQACIAVLLEGGVPHAAPIDVLVGTIGSPPMPVWQPGAPVAKQGGMGLPEESVHDPVGTSTTRRSGLLEPPHVL